MSRASPSGRRAAGSCLARRSIIPLMSRVYAGSNGIGQLLVVQEWLFTGGSGRRQGVDSRKMRGIAHRLVPLSAGATSLVPRVAV
jgi:hypothetical protein